MTRIFLIRHAEAEGNLIRVAHGQYDSNITPQGYRQLAYLRRRFLHEQIDAVYGSDLTRTHITASAIYVPHHLQFHPLPLLREICLGEWEQMSWGEIQRADPEMYLNFNKHPDKWSVRGAETFSVVRDRMLEGIRTIARENPGKTVAATSHGAALRTLLGTLEGMSLAEIGKTGHADNTAVSLLEVDGDSIRVIFRDDASHVPDLLSTFRHQSWHKSDAATEAGLWFSWSGEKDSPLVTGVMDDETVGSVSLILEPEALRIADFGVKPESRGQRFGIQLLGQALQFARRNGRDRIRLTCPGEMVPYFSRYFFLRELSGGSNPELELDLRLTVRDIPPLPEN